MGFYTGGASPEMSDITLKKKIPKFVPIEEIEDRLDCVNRSIARLRPDIRQIVHEEMKSVVEESLTKLLYQLTDHWEEEKVRRRERPY